ncbi:transglycosylase domain-containing protein [Brockia lithotrophica]|uniref:Penicillin-binding protein n=1 Tax=Brockia lithotrophica TaxID=933949 RepID=A0A660KT81_9BACL|nr:transglycosylase domain-containing protein [Brockia lithotrophica]RKQ83676.1 penicillin-binding protein [Brockia lithotrophica]
MSTHGNSGGDEPTLVFPSANRPPEGEQSGKTPNGKRRPPIWRYVGYGFATFAVFVVAFALAGFGIALGIVASAFQKEELPSYEAMKEALFSGNLASYAYDRKGKLIGQLPSVETRIPTKLSEISPYVVEALIAAEDKNFYSHHGVSLRGIARAAFQQFTRSEIQTGGSTLTQQLVKQTLLEDLYRQEISGEVKGEELTRLKYRRKFAEIFLALHVERYFTKEQILEAYLNKMYFGKVQGQNLYGIEAAARGYFGVPAKELNLAQAAYLVGMLQSPGMYDPNDPEGLNRGIDRMRYVLESMRKLGKISEEEYREALNYDIAGNLKSDLPEVSSNRYPILTEEILEEAAEALASQELKKLGQDPEHVRRNAPAEWTDLVQRKRDFLNTAGVRIYTTIDLDLYDAFQDVAQTAVKYLPDAKVVVPTKDAQGKEVRKEMPSVQQFAAVLIDNRTGAVLAEIPNRKPPTVDPTYGKRYLSFARNQPYSPGSSIKPILAYGPALEEGVLPGIDSPVEDTPVVLPDGQKGEHVVYNYNLSPFKGLMTARQALWESRNPPAVRLFLQVGMERAFSYAEAAGISTITPEDKRESQVAAIGGLRKGTTLYELTGAYTVFPNQGLLKKPYMVERISDAGDRELYRHEEEVRQVFSPETAYMVTDALRGVVTNGTASALGAKLRSAYGDVPVAGKTGTSEDDQDFWFIGYTPTFTLGVWGGYDMRNKDQPNATSLNRGGTRFDHLSPWFTLYQKTVQILPDLNPQGKSFPRPNTLVTASICLPSGKLPSETCQKAAGKVPKVEIISGLFPRNRVPTERDDRVVEARLVVVGDKEYRARDDTPDDLVLKEVRVKRDPLQIPKRVRMLISPYPTDWKNHLPEEADPRTPTGRAPNPPQGLTATLDGNAVVLRWNANGEPDIAGYRVFRIDAAGETHIASVMSHQPLEFRDLSPTPLSAYQVVAVTVDGRTSPPSNPVSPFDLSKPPKGAPSPPKDVQVSRQADGTVAVRWNPNAEKDHVIYYSVYAGNTDHGPWTKLGDATDPSFTFTPSPNQAYVRVTATNDVGESEPSKAVPIPQAPPSSPSPPQGETPPPTGNRGETRGILDLLPFPSHPKR